MLDKVKHISMKLEVTVVWAHEVALVAGDRVAGMHRQNVALHRQLGHECVLADEATESLFMVVALIERHW